MFEGEFKGARTAYSSNSMFVAILANPSDTYDHEAIGEKIFPDGFGCIEPPGPGFGFGTIVLSDEEQDGKIQIENLQGRKNEDGETISPDDLKESWVEYFDAFFKADAKGKVLKQISFEDFYAALTAGKDYKIVHVVEFEPEEDWDDDEDGDES